MDAKIPVHIDATDPVTRFGVTAQLSEAADLVVVPRQATGPQTVVVLAVDSVTQETVHFARQLGELGCTRFVLLSGRLLDDADLPHIIEIGICGLLDRRESTPDRLAQAVRKARRGEAALPTDVLARLFKQVSLGAPRRTVPFQGLTARETQVLRFVAEGLDTDEIAERLSYSSRTVKNILHGVTTRFCLRNRSHAVAYAVREGLI
jgi:DNA-binding NarL/FixJ family response regulator